MDKRPAPPNDDMRIRCPRLGHQVPFSYCRIENRGLPCFKTLDCWHLHFPVADFLKNALSPEEWEKTFERPVKPKTVSLLELIEKAKQAGKEGS